MSAREGQWRRQQLRLVARVWKRLWVASFLSGIGYFLRFRVGEGGVYCSFFADCFYALFMVCLYIFGCVCVVAGEVGFFPTTPSVQVGANLEGRKRETVRKDEGN